MYILHLALKILRQQHAASTQVTKFTERGRADRGLRLNVVRNSELNRFLGVFRRSTTIIVSVVNLVRPTTLVSLSHSASTFVYSTIGVMQRVARVRLRHLKLATFRARNTHITINRF